MPTLSPSPTRRSSAVQVTLLGAVWLLIGSCGLDDLTGSRSRESASNNRWNGRPAFSSGLATLSGAFENLVSSSTESLFVGTIAEPAITIITASGLLEEFYGPPWYYEHGDPTDGWTDPGGVFNESLWDCERCVKWVVTDSVGAQGGGSFADSDNNNALKETYADTQIVKGTVMFRWQKGPVYVAGWCQPACFTYSGTVQVSVQPLAADLELHAPSVILATQNFTATVNPSPRQLAGFNVPMRVVSWSFQPDGSGSATVCATDTLCVNAPSGSGTLTVEAYVNGDLKTKSQYISVLSCLTGDSLLDDARIRKALKAAWDGSNSGDPNHFNRVERFGGRFVDSLGIQRDTTFPPLPGASMCRTSDSTWNVNTPGIGGPVLTWHVHPAFPPMYRQFGACPEQDTIPLPPGGQIQVLSGPSKADFGSHQYSDFLVVDGKSIHFAKWNNSTSRHDVTVFPRSSCDPAS